MSGFENSSIPDTNLNSTSLNFNLTPLFTCVLSLNILFGPPTNIYVLWLIVRGRGIASEFLNFSLSVCEIAVSVSYLMSFIMLRFPEIYTFALFTEGLYITGRPLFQCLMCVERYLAVVHPVTFLKYKPLRYKWFCSAAAWFTVLASCMFYMITAPLCMRVYMCVVVLQFVLFFSINMFCCLAVLRALRKPGPGERGKEKNQVKRKAFYLILIVIVTTVIMLTPVTILFFFNLFSGVDLLFTYLSLLCFILASFVQPVLYLYQGGKLPFLCWS